MPIQDIIHNWQEGSGARVVKIAAALLAFIALAALYDRFTIYDLVRAETYSSEEAMDGAQLARNVAEGRGYTTDSIRPLALYLLENAADPGQSSKVLAQRVPDLSNPPAYPYLLAGLMKVLPFNFDASQTWSYQPEQWISIFNQALFFVAVLLLFLLARRLFDSRVAWLSAVLFAGTRLFWRFSVSGLSTMWIIVIFLAMVWCMVAIENLDSAAKEGTGFKSILLALLTGALAGVGGLSRYSFAWMIVPVLLFVWMSVTRGKFRLCAVIVVAFAAVMAPWVARNIKLSGQCFGTAGYAVAQETLPFPGDTLERSSDPRGGLRRVGPPDIANKFLINVREICGDELPRFGGNWISGFFLAGLFLPFRNARLNQLRWFLVGSLVFLLAAQALGQTHLSSDVPEINSENLLVLVAPLAFVYGVAMFYTLLDQMELPALDGRGAVVGCSVVILCAPYMLALLAPGNGPETSPYSPRHIQQTAHLMGTNELLMSDIPSGVAWYGERSCVWLPLDDDKEFFKVDAFKPVQGLFLTQMTTDKRFLSQIKTGAQSWGQFVIDCSEHGEVPTGFPLRKAPAGLLPAQLFLSDKVRWQDSETP